MDSEKTNEDVIDAAAKAYIERAEELCDRLKIEKDCNTVAMQREFVKRLSVILAAVHEGNIPLNRILLVRLALADVMNELLRMTLPFKMLQEWRDPILRQFSADVRAAIDKAQRIAEAIKET